MNGFVQNRASHVGKTATLGGRGFITVPQLVSELGHVGSGAGMRVLHRFGAVVDMRQQHQALTFELDHPHAFA